MTDETLDEKVQYHEPLVFRVVRSLRQRHFEVTQGTDSEWKSGRRREYSYIVGSAETYIPLKILESVILQENIFLGLGNRKRQCYRHIGSLGSWDDLYYDDVTGAPEVNEEWRLDIDGRAYVPTLTQLAKELSEEYHVKIHVSLKTEEPQPFLTVVENNKLVVYGG